MAGVLPSGVDVEGASLLRLPAVRGTLRVLRSRRQDGRELDRVHPGISPTLPGREAVPARPTALGGYARLPQGRL